MNKRTGRHAWAFAIALCAAPAVAQAPVRPANETIGSWILSCPPDVAEPCLMRHRDWVVAPASGTPSAALEIQLRGDALVPVITVRGLPTSAAVDSAFVVKPTVNLGLDGGKRIDLSCEISGTDYACAPDAAAVPALAAAIPKARVLSASLTLTIPGMVALPPQDRTLELTGTAVAQARLLAAGATGEALPSYPGLDIQGFLDRIMRDLGFPNGSADAVPKLMPLFSWIWP
jgi:invasion protein IalB